jgi:uracil phosphoribosyltransferase
MVMQLIYEKLPHDIADRHVLLMDPILGTGIVLLDVPCVD